MSGNLPWLFRSNKAHSWFFPPSNQYLSHSSLIGQGDMVFRGIKNDFSFLRCMPTCLISVFWSAQQRSFVLQILFTIFHGFHISGFMAGPRARRAGPRQTLLEFSKMRFFIFMYFGQNDFWKKIDLKMCLLASKLCNPLTFLI